MKNTFLVLILFLINFSTADAAEQELTKIERTEILNIIRSSAGKELGTPLEFVVTHLKAADNYALAILNPQRSGGKKINVKETAYSADDLEGMDGLRIDAILQKQGNSWKLINYTIGSTDVWYEEYCIKTPLICKN